MLRQSVLFGLALFFGGSQTPPTAALDPEVAKGVREIENGDLDVGIFTLDAAAQRLKRQPGRATDLGQAYLYLGVAYIGKGHETLAKAHFREALKHAKELTLRPESFPPKVREVFERAREEAGPAPVETKKRGPSKGLLIGLGGAAAVGGALLVAGGGGGTSPRAPAVSATPSPSPSPTIRTVVLTGTLAPGRTEQHFQFVGGNGSFEGRITWTDPDTEFKIHLIRLFRGTETVGLSIRISSLSGQLSATPVELGEYGVYVVRSGSGGPTDSYRLEYTYPIE